MNCCVNCFADQGLRNRIKAMSTDMGECDFCESKKVTVIACEKLTDTFESLFLCYLPASSLSIQQRKIVTIHEHLQSYWPGLFNAHLTKKDIKQLINFIGRASIWIGGNTIEESVELAIDSNGDGVHEPYSSQWESFAQEIKAQNRFFTNQTLDLNLLESVLTRFTKTYPAGTEFYRARISDIPLTRDLLGKPPKEKTTPGRANPVGIPYLYISDQEETTLYETRISLHESISVGKFVLHAPLQVISLKSIANYGPFEIQDKGFDIEEFMLIRPYLLKLEEELSKPVRKQDVNLDYLPTQYLCEFIKSLGFDAVEYRSAMAEGGYNLAVFNDKNLQCVSTKHYQVKGLKYDWK